MGWLQHQLKHSEIFRQNLPRLVSDADRQEHLCQMKAEFDAAWERLTLDDFFLYRDGLAEGSGRLGLPWIGAPGQRIDDETWVRVMTPRPLRVVEDERGGLRLLALGRVWQFHAEDSLMESETPLASARMLAPSARA